MKNKKMDNTTTSPPKIHHLYFSQKPTTWAGITTGGMIPPLADEKDPHS